MKRGLLVVIAVMVVVGGLMSQNNSPLCFTARNGSVTVKFDIRNVTHTIQYSTDSLNWSTYTSKTNITINQDQSIYFRADSNLTTALAFGNGDFYNGSRFYFLSSNGGVVEGSGNIMSLYGPDCPDLPLQPFAFEHMFRGCTLLTTAPSLTATVMANSCYKEMFRGCTSLAKAPELPSVKLAEECYYYMFDGCSALITAPSLPADTLKHRCYSEMFKDCNSLVVPPVLPATYLAPACYSYMFEGCKSIIEAPLLSATVLAGYCYEYMFYRCTKLTKIHTLPATTLATGCYYSMFSSCTSLTTVPELPATTLEGGCYNQMFKNCTSLMVNYSPPGRTWRINASSIDFEEMTDMFKGTSGTMNGTPLVNTTYYIASSSTDVVEVDDKPSYVVYSYHGRIYVDGASGELIKVYDVNGRLIDEVLRACEEQEFVVNVDGVYFVRIDDNETVKVVVR